MEQEKLRTECGKEKLNLINARARVCVCVHCNVCLQADTNRSRPQAATLNVFTIRIAKMTRLPSNGSCRIIEFGEFLRPLSHDGTPHKTFKVGHGAKKNASVFHFKL